MKYLEILIQAVFAFVILGSVALLVWALVSDLMGWYEPDGKYRGPFSNRK